MLGITELLERLLPEPGTLEREVEAVALLLERFEVLLAGLLVLLGRAPELGCDPVLGLAGAVLLVGRLGAVLLGALLRGGAALLPLLL